MRGTIRCTRPSALLAAGLAAMLAAGCSAAPYRATVATCFAFGVRALERHITVTTAPRACAGLSHAQVNLALAGAVRDVAGPAPKARARRREIREGRYLGRLITTVPPPRPASAAAAPGGRSSSLPFRLAALAAWIVTAAAGGYLLAGWLQHSGPRRPRSAVASLPLVIVGHFVLAAAGLALWIAFAVTGLPALAWVAAGLILLVAGFGMAALATALPEPATGTSLTAGTGPADDTGPATGTGLVRTAVAKRARARIPVTVIAVHGALATATILLVLLAAVGAG